MQLSVIVPVYNERDNIEPLMRELVSVLEELGGDYEIICVDDGSTDGGRDVVKTCAAQNQRIKLISFARNFGQTAALAAGIDHASGDVIVPIDADLENDPRDIPHLLAKLDRGYDIVSGWRKNRWSNKWFTRKIPSAAANKCISLMTGVHLNDHGCTLKAYRRSAIIDIQLYGEMHRFIPVYASWNGAKITELVVNHRERQYGRSKYGLSRLPRVLLDLVLIRFLDKYMTRPMHFFGGVGFISVFLGILTGTGAVVLKVLGTKDFVETPLLLFAAFLTIIGVFRNVLVSVPVHTFVLVPYARQNMHL